MEEILYSFEKGRIIPDAEPIVMGYEAKKALDEELKKTTPVTVGPLEPAQLFDLLQSKIDTKLSLACNTVEEYTRVIETGEIRRQTLEEQFSNLQFPYKAYDGPRLWREAALCQYMCFSVKGTVVDTPDDNYWVSKIAKWYNRKIDEGKMFPRVLACQKLTLALYDPVDEVFISLSKEGDKYIVTKSFLTYSDIIKQQEYVRRAPAKVLNNYSGLWDGERKVYTAEEIMRFEKKTLYMLFAFPTMGASWAVGNVFEFYKKHFKLFEPGAYARYNIFWNEFMDCTWFQNEGELASTIYDIKEQEEK